MKIALVFAEKAALLVPKPMQRHLRRRHAAKGKGGEHVATSRSIFIVVAKSIGYRSKGFLDTVSNKREN